LEFIVLKDASLNVCHEFIAPNNTKIVVTQTTKNKKIRLTFDTVNQTFKISAPQLVSFFDIQLFLKRNFEWMEKQLLKPKISVPIFKVQTGEKLFVLGLEYTLLCTVDVKKSVIFDGHTIKITGPKRAFSKILEQGLKDFIQKILFQRCFAMANRVGRSVSKITVKETKSRWGSCSSKGNLNFSWRLVFAPSYIVDYLCAHEVAHLVEMNHSHRFWSIVKKLHEDFESSKQWLKKNGKYLLHIVFEELPYER
jgi:predicted metal-dependent hydrolase